MAIRPARSGASPWQELREMREELDRFLTTAFRGAMGRGALEWTPPVDIIERENELVLTAELPGMRREDVEVELENNVLTIRGEKRAEHEEKGEERYIYERQFGEFTRSFTLPRTVDADRIRARFSDGVLTVTMPKVEESRGKRIDIEGGEEAR